MKRMLIALLAGALLCFAGCTGIERDGDSSDTTEKTTDAVTDAVTDAEPTGTRDYTYHY